MRTYFRNRIGFTMVRGGLIIDLQKSLAKAGVLAPSVDGKYGGQTAAALRIWQASKGLPVSGEVDELSWTALVGGKPSIFRRCLSLTAAFEGHGYTFAAGNWDGALVTWGIVGFTLAGGNLQKVINTIDTRYPALLAEALGMEKSSELRMIIKQPKAQQATWANSISAPPKKYRLRADWAEAFENLGNRPEARLVQDEVARDPYWKRAVQDMRKYGKPSEADCALFFDTAVQNGGVGSTKGAAINKALQQNPGIGDRTRLSLIADAIADNSSPKFASDVRSRRQCIAKGDGPVHGATYKVEDWGIDLMSVGETDLAG